MGLKDKERCHQYYLDNREYLIEKSNKQRLKRVYGISYEQYEEIYNSQKGQCKICGVFLKLGIVGGSTDKDKSLRAALDHCHKTGKLRGILCGYCNRGLGLFQDSPEKLRLAAKYLEND